MEIKVKVEITSEGHKTEFRVEEYKKLPNGQVDLENYKKCLTVARNTIDSALAALS